MHRSLQAMSEEMGLLRKENREPPQEISELRRTMDWARSCSVPWTLIKHIRTKKPRRPHERKPRRMKSPGTKATRRKPQTRKGTGNQPTDEQQKRSHEESPQKTVQIIKKKKEQRSWTRKIEKRQRGWCPRQDTKRWEQEPKEKKEKVPPVIFHRLQD